MLASQLSLYPTPIEIIRVISLAFDVKYSNKKLDDKALEKCVDYREIDQFIQSAIHEPIEKYVDQKTAECVSDSIKAALEEYLTLIGNLNADGLTRAQVLPLLVQYFFHRHSAVLLARLHEIHGGIDPVVLVSNQYLSVSVVIDWLNEHEKEWPKFIKGIDKEQQDRIAAWHKGTDLPSNLSIHSLHHFSIGPENGHINWPLVKSFLLIARAIDFARRKPAGLELIEATRIALWSGNYKNLLPEKFHSLQREIQSELAEILPSIAEIGHKLNSSREKPDGEKEYIYELIRSARAYLTKKNALIVKDYCLDWNEARWYALTGDIKNSCKYFKIAFYGCLFRAGKNQKTIIEQALVIAASARPPDKVFLKHLKNAAITFKYELPSLFDYSGSFKSSDVVQDWEVTMWASHLSSVFPQEELFPGARFSIIENKLDSLIYQDPDLVKPDYRYPNRKIKIGVSRKKTLPQIVWFSELEKLDVVEKLVQKEVNINVWSESGDTPILMALEALNATIYGRSMDDRLFSLISKQFHDTDTINKRTAKKKMLPLMSAVDTGKPDIVEKVLEMGALPDARGLEIEATALSLCLGRVALLKNIEAYIKQMMSIPLTPEALDSVRRHIGGLLGFTLEQNLETMQWMMSNEENQALFKSSSNLMMNHMKKHMKLEKMRTIAHLLLDYGAGPNTEHSHPIKGYTPLMLAAELDEGDIFKKMLRKGGEPKKTYYHGASKKNIDCWEIANYFKSHTVLVILNNLHS